MKINLYSKRIKKKLMK